MAVGQQAGRVAWRVPGAIGLPHGNAKVALGSSSLGLGDQVILGDMGVQPAPTPSSSQSSRHHAPRNAGPSRRGLCSGAVFEALCPGGAECHRVFLQDEGTHLLTGSRRLGGGTVGTAVQGLVHATLGKPVGWVKGPGLGASARPALLLLLLLRKGHQAPPLGHPGEEAGQSHFCSHSSLRPDECEVGEAPQEQN